MITSGSWAGQRGWRAEARQSTLVRFVLLSMLLHATIVVLFGTSHGGGAARDEGAPNVLDVTLRRQATVPEAGLRSGPGGQAAADRPLLRRADERPLKPAPATTEPLPAIEPPQTHAENPGETAPPEAQRNPPEAETAPPAPSPPIEPFPRIDLLAPQEADRPLAPPLITPSPIERLAPPPSHSALAAPLDLAPPVIPLVPAPPIERIAAPAPLRPLAPPVELPPREAPIVPPPIDRLAAPRIEHEFAPSPNLVAPIPSIAPVAAPSTEAPRQVEQTALPASAPQRPPSEATVATPAPDAPAAPAAGAELPRLRLGAPGADEDIFKPRRDVVAAPGESGGPHIDLEAARKRAREIASEASSTRGILPALPPPPEKKSKESIAFEKAIKPDCRTAYAGLGLLAVPVLVANAIGDGGCRW